MVLWVVRRFAACLREARLQSVGQKRAGRQRSGKTRMGLKHVRLLIFGGAYTRKGVGGYKKQESVRDFFIDRARAARP